MLRWHIHDELRRTMVRGTRSSRTLRLSKSGSFHASARRVDSRNQAIFIKMFRVWDTECLVAFASAFDDFYLGFEDEFEGRGQRTEDGGWRLEAGG